MMPDFFALPRPPRPTKTLTVEGDGRSLTLTLRSMDLLDMHRMLTLRDRMVERYVPFASRRRPPEADAPEPVEFPPVGGEPVTVSEETCEACATLAVMQPDAGLAFEQWVACVAACPHLFEAVVEAAAALNRSDLGKASGPGTTSLSAGPWPPD